MAEMRTRWKEDKQETTDKAERKTKVGKQTKANQRTRRNCVQEGTADKGKATDRAERKTNAVLRTKQNNGQAELQTKAERRKTDGCRWDIGLFFAEANDIPSGHHSGGVRLRSEISYDDKLPLS